MNRNPDKLGAPLRTFFLFSLFFGLTFSATADDFRIWRDKKGNMIEAELVTMNAIQVVIRDREGTTFKFPPTKLSDEDQKYLKTAFPPEIEIEFKKIQDRKLDKNAYSDTVTMNGELTIKKMEKRAYDKSMKVILIMLAESQLYNDYVIVDRAEATFDFKNSDEFTFRGNLFSMYESKSNGGSGFKYKAYLAVIFDDKNNVLEIKSSRSEFEKKYTTLLKYKKKDRITKDLRKSPRSESDMMDNGSFRY